MTDARNIVCALAYNFASASAAAAAAASASTISAAALPLPVLLLRRVALRCAVLCSPIANRSLLLLLLSQQAFLL